jgi:hypothetical protein
MQDDYQHRIEDVCVGADLCAMLWLNDDGLDAEVTRLRPIDESRIPSLAGRRMQNVGVVFLHGTHPSFVFKGPLGLDAITRLSVAFAAYVQSLCRVESYGELREIADLERLYALPDNRTTTN